MTIIGHYFSNTCVTYTILKQKKIKTLIIFITSYFSYDAGYDNIVW